MLRKWSLIALIFISTLVSCVNTSSEIDPPTYQEYTNRGDEITNLAQTILLSNVGKAIQSGGTKYAVEFCNLKASSIIDSLNIANSCSISRVSDKNRNPNNNIGNETEKLIFQLMNTEVTRDTLIRLKNTLTYYKPIKTALQACLKCHGNPSSDIDVVTLQKINQLYPNDKATGYHLDDFRGMWKVEFNIVER